MIYLQLQIIWVEWEEDIIWHMLKIIRMVIGMNLMIILLSKFHNNLLLVIMHMSYFIKRKTSDIYKIK